MLLFPVASPTFPASKQVQFILRFKSHNEESESALRDWQCPNSVCIHVKDERQSGRHLRTAVQAVQ